MIKQNQVCSLYPLSFLLLCLLLSSCSTTGSLSGGSGKIAFYRTYSEKLGLKLSGHENRSLIEEISGWIGVPYKYGGNTKQGTDCSGFTSTVYKKIYSISLYRSAADQLKNVKIIDKKDLECSDLVFFITSGKKVSHVGMYIADNKFIHASSSRGVVIDDLDKEYYKKNYYGSGRVVTKQ